MTREMAETSYMHLYRAVKEESDIMSCSAGKERKKEVMRKEKKDSSRAENHENDEKRK